MADRGACAGFAGSRSGALIASAWAALVHLGEEGYLAITRDIMQVRPQCLGDKVSFASKY